MKAGEFYSFTPDKQWCREGFAEAISVGTGIQLVDTYWQTTANPHEHGLSLTEMQTIELLFDLNEFQEMHASGSRATEDYWQQFTESDRKKVTSQHGLQCRHFVRKGSKPDLHTIIERTKMKLDQARKDVESAQRHVYWLEKDLVELEARSS